MKNVRLIDTTLRDGSHAINHQYTPEKVAEICRGLEASGVYAAEVGHGSGIAGSIINQGLSKTPDKELFAAARANLKNTKLATLFCPGTAVIDDLYRAKEYGIEVIRFALHCTEVDLGETHIMKAHEMGFECIGFMMMAHTISSEDIKTQAKLLASYGADAIYFADSAGAMTPQDVRNHVEAIRSVVDLPVGVHCHNNLGLAIGNEIAAVEAGATYVDGTLEGFGPSSGNANIAALSSALKKMGIETGTDMYKLLDAGKAVRPLMKQPLEVNDETVVLGTIGLYSSFYQHVMEEAAKFHLNPFDVFQELGRRKCIGGQEDMIVEVVHKMVDGTL